MAAAESSAKDNCKTSDGNQEDRMVKFMSADGKSFDVVEKVARMFRFIDSLVDRVLESGEAIPLEIDSGLLTIMLKWAERHVDDLEIEYYDFRYEMPRETLPIVIDEWDNELVSVDSITLCLLCNAASDLELEGFKSLGCKKLASMLKGKTPEEMRKIFNIPPIDVIRQGMKRLERDPVPIKKRLTKRIKKKRAS